MAAFNGQRWMLADMAVNLDAARLLIYRAASNARAGLPNAVEASMAKTYANEMAIHVTHKALQVFVGHDYPKSMGAEYYLRGARFAALDSCTLRIQRNIIAGSLLGRADG